MIMDHITLNQIKELARINEPECISIFIPTHRAGEEVKNMVDHKNLKNQIKEIRNKLDTHQLTDDEINHLLKPVNDLLDDTSFWKHQSDGLAIFRNRKMFDYYTLPVSFAPYNYLADHFFPRPLIPYINDKGRFFLLGLALGSVKFFECFPHQIDEIEVEDLLPEKLQETVGYDFRQKNLQFRTGQTGFDQSMFHGQGSANEEEKKQEILKYFRAVNKGLMKYLHDKKAPLVVATVDYLMPVYKEVNEYKYLQDEFIPGNPEQEDAILLHEKGRLLMEKFFNRDRKNKKASFEQALSDQKASWKEDVIIPEAINQRVETLFVKNGAHLWGIYDKENNRILKRDNESLQSSCLINMAAMHTIINGGRVYLTEPDEMPEKTSSLNAIFRY